MKAYVKLGEKSNLWHKESKYSEQYEVLRGKTAVESQFVQELMHLVQGFDQISSLLELIIQ